MTTTDIAQPAPPLATGKRAPLLTRPLLLRFVSIIGAAASFYLPLSVVPLYAKSAGSDSGAGLATGALLLATVAVELITPRLVSRVGYRLALTLGLVLLGAPAAGPAGVLGPGRHPGGEHRPRRGLRDRHGRRRCADRLDDPAGPARRGPGPDRGRQRQAARTACCP
jgi:hypothetical protein